MVSWVSQMQATAQQGDWSAVAQELQQRYHAGNWTQLSTDEIAALVHMAIAVLKLGDFQERWDVAKVFPGFGEAAISPLITLVKDEDEEPETRWFGVRLLGDANHPAAIQALVELLNAEEEDLREMASGVLANFGTRAIAPLTDLLSVPENRLLAVQALAQIRHSATIAPLQTVVHDDDATIRAMTIEALGSFHDPQVPPILIQALTDPVATVRRAAIAGLAVRTDLTDDLGLVDRFVDRLWDLNIGVCQQAAIALGRIGTEAAVGALSRAISAVNTPEILQIEIVRALAWIGTQPAFYSLQNLLQPSHKTDRVYQEIVIALGRWTDPTLKSAAAQVLTQALTQEFGQTPLIQQAIAVALGQLQQPAAIQPLIQLLASHDAGVRLHVIAALKQIQPQQTHQQLTALQVNQDISPELRHGIEIALQEWQIELPQ
ncbi:HEAT repeat domain-containing protein [Phormidium sp. CLA17]|uniref:HEAT repeat domain-containing protein n=1 Tax=Leptolyngbya sp. Cla-17 TaxID=2803751 RepID=UPI0014918388|nr:HEAT repeat domain-containing protein [Leptolyngbya sp. Cla-17]MBM0740747.1 HEAT repeat domain-containing protein [Leptolyngbya sp. Cla-17]